MGKKRIKVVGVDADDTLWVNLPFFYETEKDFHALLREYGDAEFVSAELYRTECGNMPYYGFGTKSFTLSMIETALRISGGKLPGSAVQAIIELGKRQLDHPLRVIDGVEEVLGVLRRRHRLVIATKGDLLEQERKLEKSGLEKYFHHIEIMSDKAESDYRGLLGRLGVAADEFAMIGNSVKSDILPVLNLGGYGVHVPFHETWVHEEGDAPTECPRFFAISTIRQVLELPFLAE